MTEDELRQFSANHLLYELEMLFFVSEILLLERFRSPESSQDNIIKNALIESFTIHLRGMTDFLYRQRRQPDDVLADNYVRDVEEWRARRGEMPEGLRVAVQRTGKEIAHLTTKRYADGAAEKHWSPQELTKAVVAPLKRFVAAVPPERLDFGVQFFIDHLEG